MNNKPTKKEVDALIGQFVKVHSPGGMMYVKGTLCQALIDPNMYSIYVDRQMAAVCFKLEHVRMILHGYDGPEIQLTTEKNVV